MTRIGLLATTLILTACSGNEVFSDILKVAPEEVTFAWDPRVPLSGEVAAGPVVRISNLATETETITIPDVPGLRLKVVTRQDDPSATLDQHAVSRNAEDTATVISVDWGFGFDLEIAATECYQGTRTIEVSAKYSEEVAITQLIPVRVRNAFVEPDTPTPDPGTPTTISSNLAIVRGIDVIEDENGAAKLLVTGENASAQGTTEVWSLATALLEHTLRTVNGRDGTAAFTPDGKLIYTVIIDDGSGFVRGDVFDAATDSIYVNSDFNPSQWLMGANKLPHRPVRLRDWIFTAPGALGEYEILATLPGPTLDGDPTVQPWIPYDLVGSGRKPIRAIAVSTTYSEVLTLNRHDADADTVISRRESAPGDNPANFFAPIGTIAGTPDRLLPFGKVGLAWEFGGVEGSLLKRGVDEELNVFDRLIALKADMILGLALPDGSSGASRAAFLRPDCIDELSVPASGSPTWRTIPLEAGAPPAKLVAVTRNGLTRLCLLREGETEVDILDLD